jgi:short-subunit dehydrogenase
MSKDRRKLALVTGASSGIGKAFAARLAADGYDLVAVGRRTDRLEELAASVPGVMVQVLAADLSTDEGVDAVAGVCASQPLAMLINNAGVAHYMPFAELPAEKARELTHVKVIAPTMLARAAVPGVVTASLRGLELGEVVCAPGVERADLLDAVFAADLAAFGAQSPELATRYRDG